jgi:adhesin transport system membrane fusion protein
MSMADKPEQDKKLNIVINQAPLEEMRLQQEDVDFVRDSRAAMLAKSTPLANVLLAILVLFLLAAVIWLQLAKLDEVTRGMGKVVPASEVQIIQNLEGGILSKIFVQEGDSVTKGQVLTQLDDTRFAAQYKQGYTKYASLLATIARLTAETENKSHIIFPPEVTKNLALVRRETNLFNSERQLLKNTLFNLEHSYKIAVHELNITKPLVKQGVMSKIELLRIQRDVNAIKTRMDSYKDNFYESAFSELNQYKAEASVLAENLAALKDRMQRTTITSPVDGIIKQIYFNTIGGVIEPAKPIMEVVPLNDKLIIEAHILPKDIAFIKAGQDAKVKITAYDYSIYGGLDATVTHVSADTSMDPRGNPYYEVDLTTDKNYFGSKKGSLPIMVGMTAQVDIITGKKPVLNYLLKPFLKAKEKAMRER